MPIYLLYWKLLFLFHLRLHTALDFSEKFFMKEIDGYIYVGGLNSLDKYIIENLEYKLVAKGFYGNNSDLQNATDGFSVGFTPVVGDSAENDKKRGPKSLAFDNCLNWKDEQLNDSVRLKAYDPLRFFHHTASGDRQTMDYTCLNNFIKGIEVYDNDTLWVCGTFGAFPRAFTVNQTNLEFIKMVDTNIMSCARYIDEPMATYRDNVTKQLYIASGWGLYRPDMKKPDVRNNNSTMMYADWRLYRNLFKLPSTMAWVLSSDVNFIKVVKDSGGFLYFFGHEISNQYGLNNQEDRHAWQSFMLRICKKDLGFKYVDANLGESLKFLTSLKYFVDIHSNLVAALTDKQSYSQSWYQDHMHLPTTHFTTPLKINFGCYIGRRPRSISDNQFWGDTNVVYLNRLADIIFDPERRIKFSTTKVQSEFGCNFIEHSQIPLIGLFNMPGILDTGVKPTGALCQLQINENIFPEYGIQKPVYQDFNSTESKNSFDEIMSLSSTTVSNFYSRTLHRISGHSLHPYWNQGVLIGQRDRNDESLTFEHIGTCEKEDFYKTMTINKFLNIMNFSNTAWPNELPNRLTSITSSVCQYSTVELYSFNATFVIPGVEFKRIFLIKDNITDYNMNAINKEDTSQLRRTSPLMVVLIISTQGDHYRVVLCDFDNAMANRGQNHSDGSWYNHCIFRHTDQPYLYRQYTPMENRPRGEGVLFRASSLLKHEKIDGWNETVNSNFHFVKETIRKEDYVHVLTSKNLTKINWNVDCKTYRKCTECASDPYCMWNISDAICTNYSNTSYNDTHFVQDVLDRGFRCASHIKKNVSINFNSTVEVLNCSNSGFWRGRIEWEMGNASFKAIYSDDKTVLTLIHDGSSQTEIHCIGVRDDNDMLYRGREYDYIKTGNFTRIILNTFSYQKHKEPVTDSDPWIFNKLCLVLVITIILIILITLIIPIRKCQKKGSPSPGPPKPSENNPTVYVPFNTKTSRIKRPWPTGEMIPMFDKDGF